MPNVLHHLNDEFVGTEAVQFLPCQAQERTGESRHKYRYMRVHSASREYRLVLFMTPSSHMMESPEIPGGSQCVTGSTFTVEI